jgi:hypothetical protein
MGINNPIAAGFYHQVSRTAELNETASAFPSMPFSVERSLNGINK